MKKSLARTLALLMVLSLPLALVACDQNSSVAKIGRAIGPLSKGLVTEFLTLKQSGVITQKKYDELIAKQLDVKAEKIGNFLANVKINAGNKQEVIDTIRDGVNLFQDVAGSFATGSTATKIIGYVTTGLNLASIAVGLLDPPAAPASFALGRASDSGIPSESVRVKLPPVPNEVKKYLK